MIRPEPPGPAALRRAALLALAPALLSACAAAPQCPAGSQPARLDQLYFGTSRPQGPAVSEVEWQAFVQEEIAPRFPQGFTLLEAQGQWRNADGSIAQERSHVLQLLHPDDAPSTAAIRAIAARYKARFQQEAVLQVASAACGAL